MPTAHAQHFYWDPNNLRCEVDFGDSFLPDFAKLNQKLAALAGAEWETPGLVDNEETYQGCLICPPDKVEETIMAAKAILKPVLPVTIVSLGFIVRYCGAEDSDHHHGRVSKVEPTYMPGMAPTLPRRYLVVMREALQKVRPQDYLRSKNDPQCGTALREAEEHLTYALSVADNVTAFVQQMLITPDYCCT